MLQPSKVQDFCFYHGDMTWYNTTGNWLKIMNYKQQSKGIEATMTASWCNPSAGHWGGDHHPLKISLNRKHSLWSHQPAASFRIGKIISWDCQKPKKLMIFFMTGNPWPSSTQNSWRIWDSSQKTIIVCFLGRFISPWKWSKNKLQLGLPFGDTWNLHQFSTKFSTSWLLQPFTRIPLGPFCWPVGSPSQRRSKRPSFVATHHLRSDAPAPQHLCA